MSIIFTRILWICKMREKYCSQKNVGILHGIKWHLRKSWIKELWFLSLISSQLIFDGYICIKTISYNVTMKCRINQYLAIFRITVHPFYSKLKNLLIHCLTSLRKLGMILPTLLVTDKCYIHHRSGKVFLGTAQ